jgi:hypothetical protein
VAVARRRGVGAGRRNGPARPSGPYRGLFAPPYNAADRLSIPSPIGGANAMHPDVVDFGTTWNGARYWMAFTPYNGTGDTEVPCVAGSSDLTSGGTWTVPAGFTNPLTPDPEGITHMADTDLTYDEAADRLYVLYITTDANTTFQDVRAKWTDGDGTWSSEITVLAGTPGTYLNPSVVKTDTGWRLYYTKGSAGLYYRETTTSPAAGYGSEVSAPLDLDYGLLADRNFQNVNIVRDTDGAIVAIVSDANTSTINGTMFFARSTDDGDTFTITGPPVLAAGPPANWDAGGIYRASIVTDTDGVVVTSGDNLHLFYSGYRDGISTWGTGYTQIPAQFIRL